MKKKPEKNKALRAERRKKKIRKLFVAATVLVLACVLSAQMVGAYRKKQAYEAEEQEKEAEKKSLLKEKESLKNYEEYTKTDEYVEDTAKSKLGMVNPNEIIFREKD